MTEPIPSTAQLLAGFKALLLLAEVYEETIEMDRGSARSLERIEADGDLPPAIVVARHLIAHTEERAT